MRRSLRSRRRLLPTTTTEISLTPLIDTALTLLIIFMVTTPMIQNAIKVALPKGNSKEAEIQQQDIVVVINKEGVMHLHDKPYDISTLLAELKKISTANNDKTVVVRADHTVSYGTVIAVVDQIKHIEGIAYVALAMEKRT